MRTVASSHRSALKKGFSLIEILVAMTILMIIVLIVAGIFQSTSTAWSIGLRRADEQSVTRAVVGAISRDLSMMVDSYNFIIGPGTESANEKLRDDALSAGALSESLGDLENGVLDFWVLKTPDITSEDTPPTRSLAHIVYETGSGKVTRTETLFDSDGTQLGNGESFEFDLGSDGSVTFETEDELKKADSFTSLYNALAVRIVVKPTTPTTIDDYEIHVGSCGLDGEWDTDDDIKPWVED